MKRLLVVLLALAGTARAHADDDDTKPSYRAIVDRVDLEPASITGYRLRVYLSALALQGQLLDLTDPKTIKLYIGANEKKAPYALGTYSATSSETAVVVLVQATLDYSDVFPMITDALDRDLFAALGDRTQLAVLTFGESVGTGKLAGVKAVRAKLGALANDASAGDPALLDTLDRALLLLRKAKTEPEGRPLRKIIVVIGDGRDRAGDKDRVTRAGKKAATDGVRIHTIAFSSSDSRRPMLALGELSKQSLGSFRWVRKGAADSWSAAVKQLRDEITKQYVLTYFVTAEDDVTGKKLHVVTVGRTQATSNELKVPQTPMCAGAACEAGYCADDTCLTAREVSGRGVFGWLLLIGGFGVGAIVVLGLIGFVMSKRQVIQPPGVVPGAPGVAPAPKPKKQPKPGKQAPAAAQPGLLPSGRPIPALLITSGPRTGERLLLRNGFMIGKTPGCDLLIEDGYTSGHHAQIGMDAAGNCRLYDRGSTNGTYINGMRVSEQQLEHGVTVRIGSTELRFLAQ